MDIKEEIEIKKELLDYYIGSTGKSISNIKTDNQYEIVSKEGDDKVKEEGSKDPLACNDDEIDIKYTLDNNQLQYDDVVNLKSLQEDVKTPMVLWTEISVTKNDDRNTYKNTKIHYSPKLENSLIDEQKCTDISEQNYVDGVLDEVACTTSSIEKHNQLHSFKHTNNKTGDEPHVCNKCRIKFRSFNDLKEHKCYSDGLSPVYNVCDEDTQLSDLNKHERTRKDEEPYVCDVCDKGFIFSNSLAIHKRTHTGEKPYVCDVCHKAFTQSSNLATHKRIHMGKKTHKDEKSYACDICNKAFNRSADLTKHKHTHTGEKPYVCDVCHRAFAQSSNLAAHKRIHTGKKPYVCDVCHRAFNQSSNLASHKRIHTGEKSFICDVCNKKFTNLSYLVGHKRIHTGERPYVCDVCHKDFRTASCIALHKRTHTGEKPYVCDVCNKTFISTSSLAVHKRCHTGEKPYACDVCNKKLAGKSTLMKHKLLHTGENL